MDVMPFKNALYPEEFKKVTINWSRPMLRENFLKKGAPHDETAQLYMIIGKYNTQFNLFYIGKTNGYISDRLSQNDHLERYNKWKKDHPRNRIHVSLGTIELSDGKMTKKSISDIETLLIYSHFNDDHNYMANKKQICSYNMKNDQYRIVNKGYNKPLYKEILIGIFI